MAGANFGARVLLIVLAAVAMATTGTACSPRGTPENGEPEPTAAFVSPARLFSVISVDWSASGAAWEPIADFPYGNDSNQLGIHRIQSQEPIVPSAMAPLSSSEFVVADPAKRRIVTASQAGKVIEEVAKAAQVASDLVWDVEGQRVVWIDNESTGSIGTWTPSTQATYVRSTDRLISRLAPTESGTYMWSAPTIEPNDASFTRVLELSGQTWTTDAGPIALNDGTKLHLEPASRAGERWLISRSGHWRLDLAFEGVNGPGRLAVPLTFDMLVRDNTLILSPLVGTYQSTSRKIRSPLVIIEIDLRTGEVLRSDQLSQCDLGQDANVASRLSVDYNTGQLYQWCVGRRAAEIRRGWQVQ